MINDNVSTGRSDTAQIEDKRNLDYVLKTTGTDVKAHELPQGIVAANWLPRISTSRQTGIPLELIGRANDVMDSTLETAVAVHPDPFQYVDLAPIDPSSHVEKESRHPVLTGLLTLAKLALGILPPLVVGVAVAGAVDSPYAHTVSNPGCESPCTVNNPTEDQAPAAIATPENRPCLSVRTLDAFTVYHDGVLVGGSAGISGGLSTSDDVDTRGSWYRFDGTLRVAIPASFGMNGVPTGYKLGSFIFEAIPFFSTLDAMQFDDSVEGTVRMSPFGTQLRFLAAIPYSLENGVARMEVGIGLTPNGRMQHIVYDGIDTGNQPRYASIGGEVLFGTDTMTLEATQRFLATMGFEKGIYARGDFNEHFRAVLPGFDYESTTDRFALDAMAKLLIEEPLFNQYPDGSESEFGRPWELRGFEANVLAKFYLTGCPDQFRQQGDGDFINVIRIGGDYRPGELSLFIGGGHEGRYGLEVFSDIGFNFAGSGLVWKAGFYQPVGLGNREGGPEPMKEGPQ